MYEVCSTEKITEFNKHLMVIRYTVLYIKMARHATLRKRLYTVFHNFLKHEHYEQIPIEYIVTLLMRTCYLPAPGNTPQLRMWSLCLYGIAFSYSVKRCKATKQNMWSIPHNKFKWTVFMSRVKPLKFTM